MLSSKDFSAAIHRMHARAEGKSLESEASQASMYCFDHASSSICFVSPALRICVPEWHQKRMISSTAQKVFFQFPVRL